MNIKIKTIPHNKQRYETVGDYWENKKGTEFRVSDMKNNGYEFLVILHELIEYTLVKKRGIKIKDIDAFDKKFEADRLAGLHTGDEEPGFAKDSPYRKEHAFATKLEKLMAKELGVDFDKYDQKAMSL